MPHETVVQRWDDETVLVDLGGAQVARVQPRPSVWPALLLAVFTLLTGAGLAMSTNGPRPGDHAVGPPAASSATSPGPTRPTGPVASTAGSVASRARAVRASDGHWAIRVSGVAARGVSSIDVRVLVGGAVVGRGAGRIDPAVSLGPVEGLPGADVAPWSADIPLATMGPIAGGDAVATVEIRRTDGSGLASDARGLVVTLGDGRMTE